MTVAGPEPCPAMASHARAGRPATRALGAVSRISYPAGMREMTDERLMRRYAKGDTAAFDQLYSRYRGPLYRYVCRQIKDPAASNDLYQGVWEKIIRARRGYSPAVPFRAWLFRVAHNHLVDFYRSRRPQADVGLDRIPHTSPDPAQELVGSEQHERLLAAIHALPVEQKNTLMLKLEGRLTIKDIAAVTGVGPQTVKSRLRYAVGKLKRSLAE